MANTELDLLETGDLMCLIFKYFKDIDDSIRAYFPTTFGYLATLNLNIECKKWQNKIKLL